MKPFWERLSEGEEMLPYMGFAWRQYTSKHYIAILFPFNHIIALLRRIWYKIRHATKEKQEVATGQKIHEAWVKGKEEGRLDGYAEVRGYLLASKFNELSLPIILLDMLDEKKRKIYGMEDYKT